jgi:hypothetical protein
MFLPKMKLLQSLQAGKRKSFLKVNSKRSKFYQPPKSTADPLPSHLANQRAEYIQHQTTIQEWQTRTKKSALIVSNLSQTTSWRIQTQHLLQPLKSMNHFQSQTTTSHPSLFPEFLKQYHLDRPRKPISNPQW